MTRKLNRKKRPSIPSAGTDTMKIFCHRPQIVPLTKRQEFELARYIRGKDDVAKEKAMVFLVCANFGLPLELAHQFKSRGVSLLDLIHIGYAALFSAVGKYDTAEDVNFMQYATKWIKRYMRKEIECKNKQMPIRNDHEGFMGRMQYGKISARTSGTFANLKTKRALRWKKMFFRNYPDHHCGDKPPKSPMTTKEYLSRLFKHHTKSKRIGLIEKTNRVFKVTA